MSEFLDQRQEAETEFDSDIEALMDVVTPLGFEPNVVDWSGGEPFASKMLDDGRCIDLTAKVRMWCSCCDLDGTHHHDRCDHPCCPENDQGRDSQ